MPRKAFLYLALGMLATVGMGQTPNRIIRDPEATASAEEPAPRTHQGTGDEILVDGAVAETKADPPCYPAQGAAEQNDRFINCGNGTVFDTVSGLLWLEWANCRSCFPPTIPCPVEDGERSWWAANALAANLSDGECLLSDHSQEGDWRLPTEEEWNTLSKTNCASTPRIFGKNGACYSDMDNAWALEVVETGKYWSAATCAGNPADSSRMDMSDGLPLCGPKTETLYAWPVRDGW
jgi:hypothetical protein